MAHNRSRGFRGGHSVRRQTQWLELDPVAFTLTGEGGTVLFVLTTAEKALRPFTIVRTHLAVHIRSD